ncbi:MAG: PIN domain-containing protein [Longimicrobiales bacterium]|nr:PIN domain-containing protein [Longimicrobiales bacterium]
MGVLIDTSVLVAHERGHLDLDRIADEQLRDRADDPFFISVITVSELLHGAHRARDRVRRARRTAFVEGVIEVFPTLQIDLMTARTHADLGADLAANGTPVGTHDLWIAASAVARGLSLVTLNLREFERVPGLEVEVWS